MKSLPHDEKLVDIKLSFLYQMEEKILFEDFLFGDGNKIVLDDMEFCVDRIVMLPKIRPHQLEKAVDLSIELCNFANFRQKLLENSNKCPVLIYKLYKRGVFVFEDIKPFLEGKDTLLVSYYFWKEIEDFESFIHSKCTPIGFAESFHKNANDIDQLIEYGFHSSSIEYCLKYDVIHDLINIDNLNQETKWSPFEWSYKPEYLDLLSFAGFFGSIKCFKHLLMNGFKIKEIVLSMVVCSGCFDLFHLCQERQIFTSDNFCKASEFFHIPLLAFMIENGAHINPKTNNGQTPLHCAAQNGHLSVVEYLINQKAKINAKTNNVEFLYLMRLLFIVLLKMVILVLLNI